jgi:S-(hydroxymethyl)glutathione dehydrogenase/alcohol dehydrogenase
VETRAALLRGVGAKWEVETLELDQPKAGEVLVRMMASGLCHSDDHSVTGDVPHGHHPFCGGHEGAGIVVAVGPQVETVKAGQHVVTSFIASCGRCRWCATGNQNLCDNGATMLSGAQLDGTFRMHLNGVDVGQFGGISTFAEYSVLSERCCIPIPDDIGWNVASLLGCGVPTGWGSAVNGASVTPGDIVIVMGVGGVGMNVVQGAWIAGAERVVAVDPVAGKREAAARFGATDAVAHMDEATDLVRDLTNGQGADAVVITVGVLRPEHVTQALAAIRKAGTVVVTSISPLGAPAVELDLFEVAMYQKRIQGVLYGVGSPARAIPRLVDLYRNGRLLLDELITTTYSLSEINTGYADMHAGRNIRGVLELRDRSSSSGGDTDAHDPC